MHNSKETKSEIEKAGADLLDFALDREDVNWLMDRLPQEADIKRVTVEYELQILKIIGVGWSLSYYLGNSPPTIDSKHGSGAARAQQTQGHNP